MIRSTKRKYSKRDIIVVALPILFSALTLAFGIIQYLDKRSLEKSALASDAQIKDLDRRNRELETQDDIQIKYVETDMYDLYTLMGQTEEGGTIRTVRKDLPRRTIDKAIIDWINHVGKTMDIKISFLPTQPYDYYVQHINDPNVFKNRMSLFLVHNAGRYKVRNLVANFTLLPDHRRVPIVMDELGPKMGYMFIAGFTTSGTAEPYAVRLIPGESIQYVSDFGKEQRTIPIRSPYAIPRVMAPGIHWAK